MQPESFLPLSPEAFQILLQLMDGDSHGYAIMRDVATRTGGEVQILPGALYRHLARMLEANIIEEIEPGAGTHAQRRHYAVTEFGREVGRAEAARLARLVAAARVRDLITDSEAR